MSTWLRLMRAPLAASAASNLTVGLALAWPDTPTPWAPLALLLAASCCLYWAGMVLNDVADADIDRLKAPHRAIPSGRVAPRDALALGLTLLILGVILVGLAAVLAHTPARRGLLGGAVVATYIASYDFGLKRFRALGSLNMGACRLTNALLAAYVLGVWPGFSWSSPATTYALALGLYVSATTWFSTYEDTNAPPLHFALGALALLATPLTLAALLVLPHGSPPLHPTALIPLTIWGVSLLTLLLRTIEIGTVAAGHTNTRTLLRGLYWLDLTILLGTQSYWALPLWATAYLAGTLGAKALFKP